MYFQKLCFFAAVVIGLVNNAFSMTLTQEDVANMKRQLHTPLMECVKELDITAEHLVELSTDTEAVDGCFYACLFKKIGIMDDKGMFDPEKTLEYEKPYAKDDEDMEFLKGINDDCISVNDESDGAEGCERAALLETCFAKHEEYINFV